MKMQWCWVNGESQTISVNSVTFIASQSFLLFRGGHYQDKDKVLQDALAKYLIEKNMTSNFFWELCPNSADTGKGLVIFVIQKILGLWQNDISFRWPFGGWLENSSFTKIRIVATSYSSANSNYVFWQRRILCTIEKIW